MNFRFVCHQLGLLLLVLGMTLLLPVAWAVCDWATAVDEGEIINEFAAIRAMGATVIVGGVVGLLLVLVSRRARYDQLGRREALLLVALSWIVGAALAAAPYLLWAHLSDMPDDHPFRSPVSCYFESMSGFTTTGATVLSDIEPLPDGLLLWRALTQWLGGLGIVVLFVAVLPTIGVGGKRLYQFEAPGPQQQGVRPRIRETARVLWLIYCALTVTQIILLRLAGMNWLDAACHTFATLATGGFSTRNPSIGYYNSVAIDIITILFMILAGVNFGLFFQMVRGRWRHVWKDTELRVYLSIIFIATVIITFTLMRGGSITSTTGIAEDATFARSARDAAFQTVSIQTTTGFATADFNLWTFMPKALLVSLMFVGASAGSTGGGIKVIRIIVAFKVMFTELERAFRPNVVRTIRVGRAVVDAELRLAVLSYILGILVLFLVGTTAIMLFEPDDTVGFITASTATAATLNNIGPGLDLVGAVGNYGFFTPASKIVMCVLMALGRLEVFAILVLFLPRFWRSE